MERLYHVIVINNKTGAKVYMTAYPDMHEHCCTMLSKLTRYPWRTETLEQV